MIFFVYDFFSQVSLSFTPGNLVVFSVFFGNFVGSGLIENPAYFALY